MKFPKDPNTSRSDLIEFIEFDQPIRQLIAMGLIVFLVVVGIVVFWGYILVFFQQSQFSRYILGLIIAVFAWGIYTSFSQIFQITQSVKWIREYVARRDETPLPKPPSLLTPLSNLLGTTAKRAIITTSSAQSVLDTVLSRIDEHRESTRYITNLLIFLGLLGTFIGLAIAVPQISQFIQSLANTDPGNANLLEVIISGLDSPISGMGVAFSSSLLGLAGSLIIGLLELFVGISQNRFYRTLEEWISRSTRLSISNFDPDINPNTSKSSSPEVGELIQDMRNLFLASEQNKIEVLNTMKDMNSVYLRLMDIFEANSQEIANREDHQNNVINRLNDIVAQQNELSEILQKVSLGIADAETKILLRSIEIQLLRILEENANSRTEFLRELRTLLDNWQP